MKNWVCFVLLVTEVNSAYVKRQSQGCIYEGRAYQQGETWQKSCELNCVCQDASSGRYQCNSICPTYSDLPPSCILVKASGECCAKPQCNFQPAGQSSFTGTGTGTGSGSGSVPVPGSCSDQIQTCSSYGTSVCSDQSYAKWVENNCCAYCRSNTGGTGTMTGGTGTLTGGTGTMTGGTGPLTGGTGTMTGSGSGGTSFGPGTYPVPQAGTPTGGSCSDQIQTCSSYGTSVCSDQSYAKWVENNCCAYCRSNTGGTGTMTGGTGTMTGGAGTMTGGTGPLTGGTETMTGSGSGSCTDKLPNCNTFGKGACSNPTYSQWVTDNCALYCGKCGGTMMGPSTGTITGTMTGPGTGSVGTGVMPGTGTGTMAGTGGTSTGTGMYPNPQPGNSGTGMGTGTGGYCADKLSNCNTYGTGVCSNPTYSKWVTDNCALYCGKCGGTLMAPTTGTFMGPGTGTTTGTGIMTGTGSCTDKISNCNSYGTGVCSNPAYSQWVTENCGLYCGKCGPLIGPTTGAMTGPGTGSVGTGVMPGTGTGSLTGTGGTSTGTGMYPGQHPGNSGTGMGTGTGGTMTGTGTGYPVPQAGSGTGTGAGASCTDKISNCDTYGKSVCSNPTYSQWVTENCGLYCGKCGGTMTGPTTGPLAGMGTGTMTGTGTGSVGTGVMPGTGTGTGTMAGTGGCMDKTTNCAQLDQMQHICSNTGARIYAQTNCPLTCNLCPSTSCADKITNCAAYGSSVCTDATYSGWVTENCAKSCNKCSGAVMSGNGPMTGGTGPMTGGTGAGTGGMTGHLSGCVYNTQVYQQGQSWNDGCTLKCTCSDGSSGQYTCTALCVSWQLPSACTLSPPAPGKCCTTPNCPAGFSIQYPPGYQEN